MNLERSWAQTYVQRTIDVREDLQIGFRPYREVSRIELDWIDTKNSG